jgi:Protein of unknown function (DUF3168)
MSASWALQQAIFAALANSDDVKAEAGDPPRVFDVPPRDSAFPYIVVGDDAETDWSTATDAGSEHRLRVHVWSRANGHREAKLCAQAVEAALDGAELAVTGQALIDIRHLASEYARDGDGIHAVLTFRAVMEKT